MDDSHFLDESRNMYWVQGSYDLRVQTCGPLDSVYPPNPFILFYFISSNKKRYLLNNYKSLCLLAVNSKTGALAYSIYTNYTIYKYGPSIRPDGTVLAFIEGFDSLCRNQNGNFLFASVNLRTARAVPIACIGNNTVIQVLLYSLYFSIYDN